MLILAHAQQAAGHGSAGQVFRLGPLLSLGLVAIWSAADRWVGHDTTQARLSVGAAVALAAAGLVHLALIGPHLTESVVAGAFFGVSGAAELIVAVLLVHRPGSPVATRAAVLVCTGLVVVYAATRLWVIPGAGHREAVDALGLVAKALEVAAALLAIAAHRGWHLRAPMTGPAVMTATMLILAVTAQPLFGLGPEPAQVAAAALAAIAVAATSGARTPEQLARTVADATVLALLLRADGLVVYLVAGAIAGALRQLVRRSPGWGLAPAGGAALGVLVVPAFGARLEILHVGHTGEVAATLVVLLVAAVLALAAWGSGRFPAVLGFFAADLTLQMLRVAAGQTSLEAVEIPAASLGLFLIATVILADPEVTLPGSGALTAGILAGVIDVALRELAAPYPALFAVVISLVVSAQLPWLRQPRSAVFPAGK